MGADTPPLQRARDGVLVLCILKITRLLLKIKDLKVFIVETTVILRNDNC